MNGFEEQEASDGMAVERKELAPDEFYFDGPYLVFTERYHLRRGYCCNSGCRHCPYQEPESV